MAGPTESMQEFTERLKRDWQEKLRREEWEWYMQRERSWRRYSIVMTVVSFAWGALAAILVLMA